MPAKKEKGSAHNPTPWLGAPRPGTKIFSYSENQLLDQVTTEVMHAWREDLKAMQNVYQTTQETAELLRAITERLGEKMPALNKFLEDAGILPDTEKLLAGYEALDMRQKVIVTQLTDIRAALHRLIPKESIWKRMVLRFFKASRNTKAQNRAKINYK